MRWKEPSKTKREQFNPSRRHHSWYSADSTKCSDMTAALRKEPYLACKAQTGRYVPISRTPNPALILTRQQKKCRSRRSAFWRDQAMAAADPTITSLNCFAMGNCCIPPERPQSAKSPAHRISILVVQVADWRKYLRLGAWDLRTQDQRLAATTVGGVLLRQQMMYLSLIVCPWDGSAWWK